MKGEKIKRTLTGGFRPPFHLMSVSFPSVMKSSNFFAGFVFDFKVNVVVLSFIKQRYAHSFEEISCVFGGMTSDRGTQRRKERRNFSCE